MCRQVYSTAPARCEFPVLLSCIIIATLAAQLWGMYQGTQAVMAGTGSNLLPKVAVLNLAPQVQFGNELAPNSNRIGLQAEANKAMALVERLGSVISQG